MRQPTTWARLFLLAAMAVPLALAANRPPRIWILPFEHLQADSSLDYLREALPALLAVAVSRSEGYALVEREQLDHLLAEQSLTLEGLTSPESRLRIGGLLGATMMISGSFVRQDGELLISMRASDLETGIIGATVEGRGPASQPGQLVNKLCRQLAHDLDKRLPVLAPDQLDEAPAGNLHFMKGLGHYYSARYSQAIAEFILASGDKALSGICRLWLANAYMAQHQYSHAYLELIRPADGASTNLLEREVAARKRECEQHLSPEDMKTIRQLAVHQAPPKE